MPFLVPILAAIGGGSAIAGAATAAGIGVSTGLAIAGATSKPVTAIPNAKADAAATASIADQAAEDLRAKARQAGAGGRQSTILTSPLGVTGTANTQTQQKTLLGS